MVSLVRLPRRGPERGGIPSAVESIHRIREAVFRGPERESRGSVVEELFKPPAPRDQERRPAREGLDRRQGRVLGPERRDDERLGSAIQPEEVVVGDPTLHAHPRTTSPSEALQLAGQGAATDDPDRRGPTGGRTDEFRDALVGLEDAHEEEVAAKAVLGHREVAVGSEVWDVDNGTPNG